MALSVNIPPHYTLPHLKVTHTSSWSPKIRVELHINGWGGAGYSSVVPVTFSTPFFQRRNHLFLPEFLVDTC